MTRFKLVALFAILACVLGCGGQGGPFDVRIGVIINSNGDPQPNFFSAPAGSRVIVVNRDDIYHEVSFGSPIGGSTDLAPNESVEVSMPGEAGLISFDVDPGGGGSISVY